MKKEFQENLLKVVVKFHNFLMTLLMNETLPNKLFLYLTLLKVKKISIF